MLKGKKTNAIRQSVEATVRCRGDEEVEPERPAMPSLDALRERDNHQQGRQDGGEGQRMREASVTEEVAVLNPEPEADDVDVG